MARRIIQFLATMAPGDAVSDCARLLAQCAEQAGVATALFAGQTAPGAGARPAGAMPRHLADDDVLVYHHSTGSDAAELFCAAEGGRRIVVYHNVTPPGLLAGDADMAARSHRGLEQLATLAQVADLGVGVSEFNRLALAEAGFRETRVVPLALPDARREELLRAAEGRADRACAGRMLHVGRLVPHKRVEDVVRVFGMVRRSVPPATLHIVGAGGESPGTEALVRGAAEAEGGAVAFRGKVGERELAAEYAAADLYLCMSLHEGFCVPLVEAMTADVPVIARPCGAVPDTLGGAGVLLDDPDPAVYAECAVRLLTDTALRGKVIAAQSARAAEFTERRFAERWVALLRI